ncbi:uncharacterized protein DMENIID0001_158370 [Sergentomyia squamirostris]
MEEIVPEQIIPEFPSTEESSSQSSCNTAADPEYVYDGSDPLLLNQNRLSDLIRDLDLPKDKALLLSSRLREWKLLTPDTIISKYNIRDTSYRDFFKKLNDLIYCCNVRGLVEKFGIKYDPTDWRLFIDASSKSLKAALLHNEGKHASLPLAHSFKLKESPESMNILIEALDYKAHNWKIICDLKVTGYLLGQMQANSLYPCFLCLWKRTPTGGSDPWKLEWDERTEFVRNEHSIRGGQIVHNKNILIPPLHLKLGLMTQFVKAVGTESECYKYLQEAFPDRTEAKLKEGIFTGPDIRYLLKDDLFENSMTPIQADAWKSFRDVCEGFLGIHKVPDYKTKVENMIKCFKELGTNCPLKLHLLISHIDYFPVNLGKMSDEQGERIHQELKDMEKRNEIWKVWKRKIVGILTQFLIDFSASLSKQRHGNDKEEAFWVLELGC